MSQARHITLDTETGVYHIDVKGHERTALSMLFAIHERAEMFREYTPAKTCTVCGEEFWPQMHLNERVCSDEHRELRATLLSRAQARKRQRDCVYESRYLYRREGKWIAEPYDSRLRQRLKETFDTREEAEENITIVMNASAPWRIRSCTSCSTRFDPYAEGLHLNCRKCRACGGRAYVYRRPIPGTKTRPCKECGEPIPQLDGQGGGLRTVCDDCTDLDKLHRSVALHAEGADRPGR